MGALALQRLADRGSATDEVRVAVKVDDVVEVPWAASLGQGAELLREQVVDGVARHTSDWESSPTRPDEDLVRQVFEALLPGMEGWTTRDTKRAGRGVLVTTSTRTRGAQALGADYGGRIQLIDGSELVYLMKTHLDKEVIIGRRGRKPTP